MDLKKFFSLINFNQTLYTLPLAYIGLLFAGAEDIFTWIWATLALISAKTAGVSFKRIIYAFIDAKYPDADNTGEISKVTLWSIGIISSMALVYCSYMLNELCFYLSFASILLLFIYPYLKRFSASLQYYPSLVEAAAPIGGYVAETGRFDLIPFVIGIAVLLWIAGLDIIYAIQDIDSGKNEDLFSIPSRFGIDKALLMSALLYLLALTALIAAGLLTSRDLAYWISLICVTTIFTRQQFLTKSMDIKAGMTEFYQINSFVSPILFVGVFVDVMFR